MLIKRENDNLLVQEKAKQKAELKEYTKNEVAMLWQAQKVKTILEYLNNDRKVQNLKIDITFILAYFSRIEMLKEKNSLIR